MVGDFGLAVPIIEQGHLVIPHLNCLYRQHRFDSILYIDLYAFDCDGVLQLSRANAYNMSPRLSSG